MNKPFIYKLESRLANKYVPRKCVARGTFSEIWFIIDTETGSKYALKKIKDSSVKHKRHLLAEGRKLMKIANIQNKDKGNHLIVKCHRILYDESTKMGPYLLMDLCGYTLLDYMRMYKSRKKQISFESIRWISLQLLSALRFIHNIGEMVHADLKPENISIVFNDCQHSNGELPEMPNIRIIDFGNAMEFNHKLPANHYDIQTLTYRAPEVLLGNKNEISSSIDMWSLGCILCEIFAINLRHEDGFKRMFKCKHSKRDLVRKIYNEVSPFPIYLYNQYNSFNYKTIFNSYTFPLIHTETSYVRLKEHRKIKIMRKLVKGKQERSYIKQFSCFIDLVSCCLDLDPFTRYDAMEAIQHKFMLYDYIEMAKKKNIKLQMTPNNNDDNKKQMLINNQVEKYQTLITELKNQEQQNCVYDSTPVIIKMKLR